MTLLSPRRRSRHITDIVAVAEVAVVALRKAIGIMLEEPGVNRPELSSDDLARLQGCWEQVYLEVDGVLNPPDELTAPGSFTIINGYGFSVRRITGEIMLEGVFELDASTSPKSITWIDSIGADAGKRLPASYRLELNSFIFIAADDGAPRPTEFCTRPGLTMRGFIRR